MIAATRRRRRRMTEAQQTYLQQLINAQKDDLIGLWPLSEGDGTTAYDKSSTGANGAYAGTFTLGQAGIGDGGYSTAFAGGRVSLAASVAALDTPFDPLAGTLLAWGKVAASAWTDATFRYLAHIGADANNRVFVAKSGTDNTLTASYRAGGTIENISFTTSTTNWFMLALTWNTTADEAKAYLNGSAGTTQTTLGTWAGALASAFTAIGDLSSAGSSGNWLGNLACVVLWKAELSANKIARLYNARFSG